MSHGALEFVRLRPGHEAALLEFFAGLTASGDDRYFHPHPFTPEESQRLTNYAGRDLYLVALQDGQVLAYGMLRGWDEGYEVPSLGIAVHRAARGSGLARSFMLYLHAAAHARGAPRVRLRVFPDNAPARRLYESLGYRWQPAAGEQLVGLCELAARRAA